MEALDSAKHDALCLMCQQVASHSKATGQVTGCPPIPPVQPTCQKQNHSCCRLATQPMPLNIIIFIKLPSCCSYAVSAEQQLRNFINIIILRGKPPARRHTQELTPHPPHQIPSHPLTVRQLPTCCHQIVSLPEWLRGWT